MVEQHNVSASQGSGSTAEIDDMYDAAEYETKDKRANTRTTFYASDIDNLDVSQRRKKELHRVLRKHEGEDYGEGTAASKGRKQRKEQNREEWKRRLISTYAAQLELTQSQKRRALHIFMEVLNINTFGPHSSDEVALSVLNVVTQEDGRNLHEEELFRELMVSCDITTDENKPSMDSMRRLRQLTRDRVPSMN